MDVIKPGKIYFASDVHLGAPYIRDPREHEQRFVRWLDQVKQDATEIYLLGDIFDFWWEYKKVVPRGFVRTLGKIAEITDSGIPVHFFIGNHDIWTWDYLTKETGVTLYKTHQELTIQGKKFYLAHGDGLGDPSKMFKLIRRAFHNPIMQWLFATFVHPNWAMAIGQKWSSNSRLNHDNSHSTHYMGEEKEHLVLFSKDILKQTHFDYFVYGHRHLVLDLMLKKDSRILILGDWIGKFSYAVLENGEMRMEIFDNETSHESHPPTKAMH